MPTTFDRAKIGAVMVRRGYVTKDQVQECLRIQKQLRRPEMLGQILLKKGYAQHRHVQAAIVEQRQANRGTQATHATWRATRPTRATQVGRTTKATQIAPSTAPAKKSNLRLWIATACAVVPLVALALILALPSGTETKDGLTKAPDAKEPAPLPALPPAGAKEEPASKAEETPKSELEKLFFDCRKLVAEKKYGEAVQKLDEFPIRMATEIDAETRLIALREEIRKKAAEIVEAATAEAEKLAEAGELAKAADRLQELADLEMADLVGPAYDRFRAAADRGLTRARKETVDRMAAEIAALRKDYASIKPSGAPEQDLKTAGEHINAEQWADAIRVLTSVAAVKGFAAKALPLRSIAHFNSNLFAGVLLDAELLVDSEPLPPMLVQTMSRSVTRAPVDESVRLLYERAIARDPNQPHVWVMLAILHTWRHDAAAADEVVSRSREKKIPFDGPSRDAMGRFHKLKERGFPHGKPVYVDYIGPYEILTDAGPKKARELAKELEKIANEYTQVLPWSRNPIIRFRVMYFANRFDYNEYHRDLFGETASAGGAGAYYWSAIKQLVVVNCDDFLAIVRHEAFHQFLNYFVDDAPRWFNEGTAAYIEKSYPGDPHLNLRYRRDVRQYMARLPKLRELMHFNVQQWKGDPREYLFYCQASSFIYWLRKNGHGHLLDEYLRLLVMGFPGNVAFERTFGKVNLDEMEEQWKLAVADDDFGK